MNDRLYAELALRVVADECRKSLFYFLQTFWDVIIKEAPIYNWHIPYICAELQKLTPCIVERKPKPYDLIINVPPGSSKSTIVSVMWPVWLWLQDPSVRIISNSYSGGLSVDLARKSKDIINSDKFRKLFPEIVLRRDLSGNQYYGNMATGMRYATSTGGTVTGLHAHVIINDDPINPKQSMSHSYRMQAIEHTRTLSSRKVHKENTPVVLIMQRLHTEDVTGFVLNKKESAIKHICLPAEISDKVRPYELRDNYKDGLLDPLRMPRKALEEAKIDLGGNGYAGQYGQSPVVEGGNIIKSDWFRFISANEFRQLRYKQPIVFFLDTAYTDNRENDPTGIIGTCFIRGNLYITCAHKVNMRFPDLCRFLPNYVRNNGYGQGSSLRIEPKANGLSVIDQLLEQTNLNVVSTRSPKESKETRLHVNSPYVESGRVYLVQDAWNESFISEVSGFPNMPHDEYVDLLCYACDYHISSENIMSDEEILWRMR